MSGGVQPVVQAAVGNGLSFNPFSFCQDDLAPAAVGVGRGKIVDAFVVAAVVVVGDESANLGFEIAGQEVVFQQDAVLEGLVPALDLALGHRMIGRATQVFDVAGFEPFGQVARNIDRTVVRQEPGSIGRLGLLQPAGLQRQVERGGDILGLHRGAKLPRTFTTMTMGSAETPASRAHASRSAPRMRARPRKAAPVRRIVSPIIAATAYSSAQAASVRAPVATRSEMRRGAGGGAGGC